MQFHIICQVSHSHGEPVKATAGWNLPGQLTMAEHFSDSQLLPTGPNFSEPVRDTCESADLLEVLDALQLLSFQAYHTALALVL